MPRLNGIDAMAQMKKDNPNIKVVFLTMHHEPAYARRALEAGADGFVVKHSAPEELVMAIQAALKGQTFIAPASAGPARAGREWRRPAAHAAPTRDSGAGGTGQIRQGDCRGASDFRPHG
jgi:DNA-binding NarL/FixJ family response regulator